MIQALIGQEWGRIRGGKGLKFILPLVPGDEIEVHTHRRSQDEIQFQLVKDGAIAAKGVLFAEEV